MGGEMEREGMLVWEVYCVEFSDERGDGRIGKVEKHQIKKK
jgi:hypothetical protein